MPNGFVVPCETAETKGCFVANRSDKFFERILQPTAANSSAPSGKGKRSVTIAQARDNKPALAVPQDAVAQIHRFA